MYQALCAHHQEVKNTAPGNITPVGDRPVYRFERRLVGMPSIQPAFSQPCKGRPPTGVMLPDAV